MAFLMIIALWLIGIFFCTVIMKSGVGAYLNSFDNDDNFLSIAITVSWPLAIPILIGIWTISIIYKTGDYISSILAKKVRQKILKKD